MIVWVLNLDADLELAAGRSYAPSRGVRAAMAAHRARLAQTLVRAGEGVWDEEKDEPQRFARDGTARGRAFCPTPRAIALMHRAGLEPEPHPSFEVLRHVNGRAFCASLGPTLEGARFVTTLEDATRVLSAPPPIGRQWRAKRAFGMAGRAQRPIAPGALSDADVAYLRASIEREGGIQLEPEVDLVRELALHGMLSPTGALRVGRLVEQRCDATGQWLESRPLGSSSALQASRHASLHASLHAEAERVGHALHAAGYFGPFGIDAFEYRAGPEVHLNPRSEINARYSMGYPASGLL